MFWQMQSNQYNQRRAVVIGGSLSGLLAARVLSEHFDHVTIIERDLLPTAPTFRPGVPQTRHAHLLLVRGRLILEQLFPGLTAELLAAGATSVDVTHDFLMVNLMHVMPRVASRKLVTLTMTRDLLEWSIRCRLETNPKIAIVDESEAVALIPDAPNSRITGVRTRRRHQSHAAAQPEVIFHANLIVDASGRTSHTSQWLAELGYRLPKETIVNSLTGYATCWFELDDSVHRDWQLLAARHTRSGVICGVEHNRWIVTLTGVGRDYPPTDEAGFLEFARSIPVTELYDTLKDAKPLSPIYGYRRTENCLRHYERLSRWPEGFVVLGDAVCTFNPIYAQGITVSALAALTLDQCLRAQAQRPDDNFTGFGKRFQKRLARANATPWLMATSEDARHATTTGGKPNRVTRMLQHYMDRVLELAAEHPPTYVAFMAVVHLVASPLSLFQPGIVCRVIGRAVRQPFVRTPQTTQATKADVFINKA